MIACLQVACTQWKKIFMVLLGKANVRSYTDIPAMIAHYRSGVPTLDHRTYTVRCTRKSRYLCNNTAIGNDQGETKYLSETFILLLHILI